MTETQEPQDHSVIRGAVVVFGSYVYILNNYGALQSFISASFANTSRLRVEWLPHSLHVTTPVNGVVELRDVCRGCTLTITVYKFTFDYILQEMVSFNIL